MTNPPGMPEPNPNPMVEIPYLELQDLRQRAIPQEELDFFRALVERLPELERAQGERNTLQTALNDMTQERDRLRGLLMETVPTLEAFDSGYPQATVARTAFAGETPEEIALKMAEWDAARAQKASEWNSLVNYVRTQATV
jgi:hypothetical protein